MNLCGNCLEVGEHKPLDVGPDKGTQRDPYRNRVVLCEPCATALLAGDFATLHARYRAERAVTR